MAGVQMSAIQRLAVAMAAALFAITAPAVAATRVVTITGTFTGVDLLYTPMEELQYKWLVGDVFKMTYKYDTSQAEVHHEADGFSIFNTGGTLRLSTDSATHAWHLGDLSLTHAYAVDGNDPIVWFVAITDEIDILVDFVATYPQPHLGGSSSIGSSYTEFFVRRTIGGSGELRFDFDQITVSVPEPASWTLLIAGFGLAGAVLRRRTALIAS